MYIDTQNGPPNYHRHQTAVCFHDEKILAQEQEMNRTLTEALTCTSCDLHLTRAHMRRDLRSGTYNPSHDPPFHHSHCRYDNCLNDNLGSEHMNSSDNRAGYADAGGCEDDDYDHDYDGEIPPDALPPPKRVARYSTLVTPTQRWAYNSRVMDILQGEVGFETRKKSSFLERMVPGYLSVLDDDDFETGADECDGDGRQQTPAQERRPGRRCDAMTSEEEDLRFAHYATDYHIHLHERMRCSMLSLCRNLEDVRQLHGWKGEVREMDAAWEMVCQESDDENGDGMDGLLSSAALATNGTAASKDDALLAVNLKGLWARSEIKRSRLVDRVRREWKSLMRERQKQREQLLMREMQRERKSLRLYCTQDGEKMLLREMKL